MRVPAPSRSEGVIIATIGAVAAALLVTPAASANAASGDDTAFVLLPSNGSSLAETGGYFVLDAEEGQTITQSVDLRNDQDVPVEVELAAVDATTSEVGGVSFSLPGDATTLTGAWVTMDRPVVTLEPGEATTVDFTVEVPADARAGSHLAGLSASPPVEPQAVATLGENEAGAQLVVRTRQVIAVQVDVGSAPAGLAVTGVDTLARPDGLYLGIGLDNTGGTLLTGTTGSISVPDLDLVQDFSVDTFVPGTSIAYPIPVGTEVAVGDYPVNVQIDYADGQLVTYDGILTVAPEVAAELAAAAGESPGGLIDLTSGNVVGIVIAAVVGAVLTVLILVLIVVLVRRRAPKGRRRGTRVVRHAPPAPVPRVAAAAADPEAPLRRRDRRRELVQPPR